MSGGAMTQLFSASELATLNEQPEPRFARLLARRPRSECLERFTRELRNHRRFIEGFQVWTDSIEHYLFDSPDAAPDRPSWGPRLFHRAATAHRVTTADRTNLAAEAEAELRQAVLAEDHLAATQAYRHALDLLTRLHATGRDTVTLALSEVYRSRGPDALAQSLRQTGDLTLFRWMPTDLGREPRARAISWLELLRGNFAEAELFEEPDRFVIVQAPCGSCGRQIEQGGYEHPLDLAVVRGPHPLTWGTAGTPIYRTHVALMHFIVPIERIGVPWPLFQCPAGLRTDPCQVVIYKDPLNPAALAYRHGQDG
jgi:hypothetical protein